MKTPGPEPKCFCKPPVPDCPACTKPDYSKFKRGDGTSERHGVIARSLTLRGGAHA